jgi:lipid-A-disaccharide synthase
MKKVFIIAGEPSGDLLGAKLINALRELHDGNIEFYGIGGEGMQAQGLESIFPMTELTHIGFAEIVPYIPRLLRRLRQTVNKIKQLKPDVIVTIDSPGFNFRLAKMLKKQGITLAESGAKNSGAIKIIHYVAPTVWAYKPERAAKVASLFDHLMVLFPFEPPYFLKEGMKCTFVGHPVIEGWQGLGDGEAFKRKYNISKNAPLICVSPGSRKGEIKRHLEIFIETFRLLRDHFPEIVMVLPTVNSLKHPISEQLKESGVNYVLVESGDEKRDAYAASDVALAKSGTVTFELALAKLPMIVSYRVSAISAYMMRKMIKVRFVNLINIISGREVIPELLQEFCKPELLAKEVIRLLENPDECRRQISDVAVALDLLGSGSVTSASNKAAQVVLEECGMHSLASVGDKRESEHPYSANLEATTIAYG